MKFTSLKLLQKTWEIEAKLWPKKRKILCIRHSSKLGKCFAFNYSIDEGIIGQENDSPETKKYVSTILRGMFSVLVFSKLFFKETSIF